jgi:hypothetical protein
MRRNLFGGVRSLITFPSRLPLTPGENPLGSAKLLARYEAKNKIGTRIPNRPFVMERSSCDKCLRSQVQLITQAGMPCLSGRREDWWMGS